MHRPAPLPAVTEVRYSRKPTFLLLLAVAFVVGFSWDAYRFFTKCGACAADLQRNYPSLIWWILSVAFAGWETWHWTQRRRATLPALQLSTAGIWTPQTGWLPWSQVNLVVARWHGAVTLHYAATPDQAALIRWQFGELTLNGRRLQQVYQHYLQANSPTDKHQAQCEA